MATGIEAVLGHHAQALGSRNIDEVLKDYTTDSILFSPTDTFKGPERIRLAFKAFLEIMTPEAMANMKMIKQEIEGEYVFVIWSALPAISFGSDTLRIHGGKIVMQSVVFQTGR
jgi:ketosteroid isomerase-like protein